MAIALDASTPAKTTITKAATSQASAAFSPPANSLIVVFWGLQATDSVSAQSVSAVTNTGTALTWTRKVLANHSGSAPGGSAEIWWAFNTGAQTGITVNGNFTRPAGGSGDQNGGLMAVKVYTGAATSLSTAASGTQIATAVALPSKSVTTTAANSWVWGVGLNWTNSTVPTAGTAQTIVDSVNDTTSGDAEWDQKQNATTPASGTVVTINDTAPSVNCLLAVVEILAAGGTTMTATLTATGVGAVSLSRQPKANKTVSGIGLVSRSAQLSTIRTAAGIGVVSLGRFTAHSFATVSGVGLPSVGRLFGRTLSASGIGAIASLAKSVRSTRFVFGVGLTSRAAQVQPVRNAVGTGVVVLVKSTAKPLSATGIGVVAAVVSSKAKLLTLSVSGVGVVSLSRQPAKIVAIPGVGVVSIVRAITATRPTVTGVGAVSLLRQATKPLTLVSGTGLASIVKSPRAIKGVVGLGVVSTGKAVAKTRTATGNGLTVLVKQPRHAFAVSGTGLPSLASLFIPFVPAGPQTGFVELFVEPVAGGQVFAEGLAVVELYLEPVASAAIYLVRMS